MRALEKYPCSGTRSALIDTINNIEAFFKVRIEATVCLAKVKPHAYLLYVKFFIVNLHIYS